MGQLNACLSPNGHRIHIHFSLKKKKKKPGTKQKLDLATFEFLIGQRNVLCACIITIIIQIGAYFDFVIAEHFALFQYYYLLQQKICVKVSVWVFAFWVHCQNWIKEKKKYIKTGFLFRRRWNLWCIIFVLFAIVCGHRQQPRCTRHLEKIWTPRCNWKFPEKKEKRWDFPEGLLKKILRI